MLSRLCGLKLRPPGRWHRGPPGLCRYFSSSAGAPSTPTSIPPPTRQQLWVFGVAQATPMIGFGLMDNFILINLGEYLDSTVGVAFGLSTITAAGIAQIFSDVAGVSFGWVFEEAAMKLGLARTTLTPEQKQLKVVRYLKILSMSIGVSLGCLIAMSSLLFKDLKSGEEIKRKQKLRALFDTLLHNGTVLIGCDQCILYLWNKESNVLWSMISQVSIPSKEQIFWAFEKLVGNKLTLKERLDADERNKRTVTITAVMQFLSDLGWEPKEFVHALPRRPTMNFDEFASFFQMCLENSEIQQEIREGGTKWTVLTTGEILNIPNVYSDERFASNRVYDFHSGYYTQSILVVPVKSEQGEVIGLVEMINKHSGQTSDSDLMVNTESRGKMDDRRYIPFTKNDEQIIKLIAAHCASFIAFCDNN